MKKSAAKLTTKAILAHLDLSKTRFYELRKTIPEFAGNSLDAMRAAYVRHLRAAASGARPLSGTFSDGDDEIDADFERARLLRERADAQTLENQRKRRELLPTESISDAWNLMLSNFRARVLQLPNKLLPQLQTAANYAEAEQRFKQEINECLTELSNFDADKLAAAAGLEFARV